MKHDTYLVCRCNVPRPPTYLPAHLRLRLRLRTRPTVSPNPEQLQNFAAWRETTQRPHEMQNANCKLRTTNRQLPNAPCKMHNARCPSSKSFPLGFPILLSGLEWLPSICSFRHSLLFCETLLAKRALLHPRMMCLHVAAFCNAKIVLLFLSFSSV